MTGRFSILRAQKYIVLNTFANKSVIIIQNSQISSCDILKKTYFRPAEIFLQK